MCDTSKGALRRLAKERLARLPVEQRSAASRAACQLLTEHFPPKDFAALLSYSPLKTEISPVPLTRLFLTQGKTAALPRVVQGRSLMDFVVLDPHLHLDDQTSRGSFGIAEPCGRKLFDLEDTPKDSATLLVVPGLAFAKDGSRLGRGAGFYDMAIATLRGEACRLSRKVFVCGFCFALQLYDHVPKEAHDETMDAVVCEEGVIACT